MSGPNIQPSIYLRIILYLFTHSPLSTSSPICSCTHLPVQLFLHLLIQLPQYLNLYHHNMWYLQKMALKLISTQNHLLQFLPDRGLTDFSFSTSTWRTDLVCFPYIQHIIANISMSTASSKIFRDHVKFHLPKYSLPTFPCQNSISPLFFSRETNQKTFLGIFHQDSLNISGEAMTWVTWGLKDGRLLLRFF